MGGRHLENTLQGRREHERGREGAGESWGGGGGCLVDDAGLAVDDGVVDADERVVAYVARKG